MVKRVNVCVNEVFEWHRGELYIRCLPKQIITNLMDRTKYFWISTDNYAKICESRPADAPENPEIWVITEDDRGNDAFYAVDAFVVHAGGDTQIFISKLSPLHFPTAHLPLTQGHGYDTMNT